jgi:hypothetical protein
LPARRATDPAGLERIGRRQAENKVGLAEGKDVLAEG